MSYYLAGAAILFGWSEIGLHSACVILAVCVVLGTYRLAQNFCMKPWLAALAALFSPGFLVSSTTVMCDVGMLAFWIWAVVFWTEGTKQPSLLKLAISGVLIGMAILTKFSAICLIPLLAAFSLIENKIIGDWLAFFLIPIGILVAHELLTLDLYGYPHFFFANDFAQSHHTNLIKAFTTLTFIGGCFATGLLCSPYLGGRMFWFLIGCGGISLFALAILGGLMAKNYHWIVGHTRIAVEIQILLWSTAGLGVLVLAFSEAWHKRDANSWLLALWVVGSFIYAAFFYFMVNARAILPMTPAVAILMARRFEQNLTVLPLGLRLSLVASAALSLLTAWADCQQAKGVRETAELVCSKYSSRSGRLWFQGHWGFQYYMQAKGARPVDFANPQLTAGDFVCSPELNSNEFPLNPQNSTLDHVFSVHNFPWLATLNDKVGAGFYSSHWGPLAFTIGHVPPEKVSVHALKDLSPDVH
ncbi:MAG TPA: glycosyltransferase family 39 protein [Candidatus Limnocylindrales bacterium]|nr:glycosyltransferase family 39 protein [Candidatus Limnocylindrales bacterium]